MPEFKDPPPGAVEPRGVVGFLETRRCRGCPATIYWWETVNGKPSPHDQDGTSHFATCPASDRFRKDRGGENR